MHVCTVGNYCQFYDNRTQGTRIEKTATHSGRIMIAYSVFSGAASTNTTQMKSLLTGFPKTFFSHRVITSFFLRKR